jgi:glycosyltransferase involved in cell wall biosynthesis
VGIHPNTPTLLSVGRFGPEKRFPLIPSIASQLKARGLNFLWFIVGDGDEKSAIQKNISLHNVADCVILLGAKSNPHFYIKQADLLVSLSSSEACPRVIIEALILGTPVLSSNFPSIYEYLDDGLYGRIAPIENFPDAIAQLLTDKPLYNRLKSNLKNYSFDNTSLIKQLEAIF